MNTLRQISLFILSIFVFSQAAYAQPSPITATAEILQSIDYAVNSHIDFGNLPADFTSATLDPSGTGGDSNVGTGVTVANVLVTGSAGQTVLITDPGMITLIESASNDELDLSPDITGETGTNASARGGTALNNGNELTLDGTNGEGTLWIGGTLTPGTDVNGGGFDTGTYTTTFTLTINYQ